jgi:hypothetical protein
VTGTFRGGSLTKTGDSEAGDEHVGVEAGTLVTSFERCVWGCGQLFERHVGERSEYDDIYIYIYK